MTKNVGNTERMIRFLLGLILIGAALFVPMHPYAQIGLAAAGAIALITAAISFCPLWSIFGVNTCKR